MLTDVVVPRVDRFELLLGGCVPDDATRYIPVIMLTARQAGQESVRKGHELVKARFLAKPFGPTS